MAQQEDEKKRRADSLDHFTVEKFEADFLKELNKWRMEEGVDSLTINDVLQDASRHHAEYMAQNGRANLLEEENKKMLNTASRVIAFGGTKNAEELVFSTNLFKGSSEGTNKDIIDAILGKWKNSKKEKPVLLNGNYVYCGIKSWIGAGDKKLFFSIVLGSYNTFNQGAAYRKTIKPSYTRKPKKVKAPENAVKECKNCDKFKGWDKLIEGVYVEGNKVYLRYDDIKGLRKLLKNPTDGLALDIVQRKQYANADYTIVDNNLPTKGIVLKKRSSTYVFNKNRAAGDNADKATLLDVCLGKLPKGLKGEYEINLLVLQDNKVCRSLTKSYVEEGGQDSNTPLELLLMPDSAAYFKPKFVPKADNTIIEFTVPFEKNKYDYKIEDIEPIMSAMNEPDYIIEGVYIYAYSSIEGDSVANAKLQRKRGESIISAFKTMLNKDIVANVLTNDSWDLFRLVMEDGEFAYLTEMKKREAIKKINSSPELLEKLEPFLSQQRFAKVILDITYDIKGPKEEKYVLSLFNKAVKKGDMKQAYKLQYFLEEQYQKGKYSIETLANADIPKIPRNSGLLNNRIVYKYYRDFKMLTPDEVDKLEELHKLDPANDHLKFNHLVAQVKYTDRVSFKGREEFQKQIESLYGTKVPKKYVDALNTEFQFKIIAVADTLPNSGPLIESCIGKIKGFYNFKEGSWENALKLAYVFAGFKDFRFAAQMLEPFVFKENVNEQLLFTYLSLCAQLPDKIKSHRFAAAMEAAHKLNADRYCQLMGSPYLSFQIMDNPAIRKYYLSTGCEQKRSEQNGQ